jgi:anti-anti-sigma factor
MFIEVQERNEFCILRARGCFGSGAEMDYVETKIEEVRRLAVSKVQMDFHGVTSIGSMGLGFVVRVFKATTARPSGRFVIAGLNPCVREAFQVTHLSAIIPTAPDFESGMRALLDESTAPRAPTGPSRLARPSD